jgi:hypothetical protein
MKYKNKQTLNFMTIDWNWFFAAFAQCAAALIGIIGAFIISKLLGEAEKEETYSSNVEQLIIEYKYLKNKISVRKFNWHDETIIKYSDALTDAIKNGVFNNLTKQQKLQKLFEIEPELLKTPICYFVLEKKINDLTSISRFYGSNLPLLPEIDFTSVKPASLMNELRMEREIINNLKIESKTLIDKFKKTKKDINVTKKNLNPIKTTIYILAIGLLLTVIYPLHFMPIEPNKNPEIDFSVDLICSHLISIKGLLLLLLTIVVEGVFIYFLCLIKDLENKYNISISKLEEKYFSIADYCPYFH